MSRVLVVDDDPWIRSILTILLADEGHEVRLAEDGEAALELLHCWQPQVIVLDLMMPNVDGWAFRARQLAEADLARIPVIIMSAGTHRRERLQALQASAVFSKPFDIEALANEVELLAV
jgi:two-component system response regulator MprA